MAGEKALAQLVKGSNPIVPRCAASSLRLLASITMTSTKRMEAVGCTH